MVRSSTSRSSGRLRRACRSAASQFRILVAMPSGGVSAWISAQIPGRTMLAGSAWVEAPQLRPDAIPRSTDVIGGGLLVADRKRPTSAFV
jgi:hypothetical protein